MANLTSIRRVDAKKLIPYKNNAKKHSDSQIEKLANSIKEFGFISPILIDKEFNVIAGHGRLMAAQKLNLDKVPCAFVEGLTEAQRRAYILADNRLAEFGQWDNELVAVEIGELETMDLGFDISDFDFPEYKEPESDLGSYYGDERERTNDAYNLDIAHNSELTKDFWQMPVIENDGFVPERLIGFNYAKSSDDKATGIHFFVDDYQFERVWNSKEKYTDILKEYERILSPDFSLYMDMPMPMKIWNVYRSRAIGAYYQSQGIKVIPTLSWAEPETYQFCFRGIPKGSIVAVSTVGVKESADALQIWRDGMDEAIRQIEPSQILIYGGAIDYDFNGIITHFYDNEVTERWKNGR